MANVVKIKRSGTANAAPTSLEYGELALNYADGKLYYKNSSDNIVQFSGNLNDLLDVVISSPEEFQGISYNGTNWVNSHIPLVSYVRNAESNTLTTGTAVYLFGGTGDHATVKRADNSSDTTSSKTIGIAGASIAASENGPIITRGYVDGIDLSVGYSVGDILWLGTNGQFTTTKPSSPAHLVFIGVVVRASVNGIIYVATQNGYELEELHDVKLSNVASGDFLKYNGTLWINGPITLGTDTTGNYMSNVSAGNLISISHTPGEGSTATINVANGTSGQVIVANASGVPTYVTLSGDITIAANGQTTIAANSVALGTDTTGNYISDVTAGTGITITHTPGEGSNATIAVTANTYQPLDGDLTAIAAITDTSGVLKKVDADTWELDTGIYLTSESSVFMDLQVMQAMEAY
jgi:hypothetical protein